MNDTLTTRVQEAEIKKVNTGYVPPMINVLMLQYRTNQPLAL
jgi:hypothetical protein